MHHRSIYKLSAFMIILAFMTIMPAKAALISDFTGPYDPSNWTQPSAGNGSVVFGLNDTSVTLTGSDQKIPLDVANFLDIDLTIEAIATGLVSFNWSYITEDKSSFGGPKFDPFGYLLKDVFFQLTDDGGNIAQNGQTNFFVNAGDIFGFRQRTIDDQFGAGITTISQFSVSIPEPSLLLLFSFSLTCFLLKHKRRLKIS